MSIFFNLRWLQSSAYESGSADTTQGKCPVRTTAAYRRGGTTGKIAAADRPALGVPAQGQARRQICKQERQAAGRVPREKQTVYRRNRQLRSTAPGHR